MPPSTRIEQEPLTILTPLCRIFPYTMSTKLLNEAFKNEVFY
jgi:hypothetical protein